MQRTYVRTKLNRTLPISARSTLQDRIHSRISLGLWVCFSPRQSGSTLTFFLTKESQCSSHIFKKKKDRAKSQSCNLPWSPHSWRQAKASQPESRSEHCCVVQRNNLPPTEQQHPGIMAARTSTTYMYHRYYYYTCGHYCSSALTHCNSSLQFTDRAFLVASLGQKWPDSNLPQKATKWARRPPAFSLSSLGFPWLLQQNERTV
jgi:hypothetical protein